MLALLIVAACSSGGTVPPPGDDPSRFDPVAAYAEVAAFAGEGSRLVAFDAHGVRADGTVDLDSALLFGVHYQFVREVPAPPDAPPVGAGGSPDGRYHETVDVRLWKPGQLRHVTTGSGSWDYRHRGMERTATTSPGAPPSDTLISPACSLATLWAGLAAAGAPAGAVAFADYDADGWTLWVQDTPARAEFGPDCTPKGQPAPAEHP